MAKKKKQEKHIHNKPVKALKADIPQWHLPLILILSFAAYIPALSAGFVNWDDPDYVGENNFLIRDLSRLPELLTASVQGNHHPVTMISLALNYAVSGEQAWSYHLLNLLLHLVNCVLVYRLAFLLSRKNALIALTTSILFGIHPLHVESVAWVSERKDVLYGLFFIAGHISYLKYLDDNSKKQHWLTLLFLILSLLSKPAAVIFPVSLICIDLLRNRKISMKLFTEKIIFLVPAIIIGLVTIYAQKEVGATGEAHFGLGKNILFGFYGIFMYFIKMILPFKLSAFYPFPPINEKLSILYYVSPLFSVLLITLVYFSWKKYRYVVFGIGFYIINLLLVLQVFSVGSAIIAERYTYIPYIGLFYIAGVLLFNYSKDRPAKAYMILVPVVMFFSVLTFLQAKTWKDGATLWDSVIKNQPCSRAYSARATLFRKNKNYDKAIEYYTQAISLNKIDHESYNNRANIYIDLKRFDLAYQDYKNALSVKPEYHVTYDNIGAMYAMQGFLDSALLYLNKAIQIKSDYKPSYSNRGLVYMSLKRYEDAIKDWQNFLRFEPDAADIVNEIGLCHRMLGRYQEALKNIDRAIQMSPQGPFFLNRSYTYMALSNVENARRDALTARQAGVPLDASYAASLGIQ